MALVIEARLLQGRYEAADRSGARPEWPPHPARLFCALVSVAHEAGHRDALRWLERQEPPQVWACADYSQAATHGYVVTNKTSSKGGSQQWPGRTAIARSRVSALPGTDTFAMVWPHAEADAATLEVLADLAWKVPYLGRSSNPAALRVHTAPKPHPEWTIWEPVTLSTPGARPLRAPYQGYLSALDAAFDAEERADSVARGFPYLSQGEERAHTDPAVSGASGPFERMLVLAPPPRSHRPDGAMLLRATQALRGTVLSRLGPEAVPRLTGHAEDGQRHLGFFGLLDTGHPQARGHLVGMALAVPADLEPEGHTQLARLLEEPLRLRMGRRAVWELTHEPWPSRPWRLVPEAWSGGYRGAHTWVSATPVMLDRHPRPKADLAPLVADNLERAGYPRPVEVEAALVPMTPGALHRPAPGSYPPDRPRRKLTHARIRFAEPVVGPVAAGSLRYLGLGLFAPTNEEETS